MSEHGSGETEHLLPYSLYLKVWLALLILTGLTVWVSTINVYRWHVFTAMLIATVKVSLVLLYFMHLKFDSKIFSYLFIAGCVLAIPLILVIVLVMPLITP